MFSKKTGMVHYKKGQLIVDKIEKGRWGGGGSMPHIELRTLVT